MSHQISSAWRFSGTGWLRTGRSGGIVALGILAIVSLVGCASTVTRVHSAGSLRFPARWVILPIVNFSETAQAGERVEAMLDTILRQRGLGLQALDRYPSSKEDEAHLLTGERRRYDEALAWAHSQPYDYAIAGSVEEWRYKSGTEPVPAVGITLKVIELSMNRTIWSASGSRGGTSSENVSGTALVLVSDLLGELKLQ